MGVVGVVIDEFNAIDMTNPIEGYLFHFFAA